jgi:anti-sigma B factor antagonist
LQHPASAGPDAFELRSDRWGTTHTLTVAGDLDLAVADRLDRAIDDALAARPETVVVDLAAATFIDSTGVRSLVRGHHLAGDRAVHLVVLPAAERVHRVFELCGLAEALPFAHAATPEVAGC